MRQASHGASGCSGKHLTLCQPALLSHCDYWSASRDAAPEADLPGGLQYVLPGDAEAASALAEDPNVAMIAFTGSTAVGRLGGAAAGRTLKRVSLELGGNNALIVLDDADLDVASSSGAWSAFLHQGQVCMTAGRYIVLEAVADEYIEKLAGRAANLPVGDPRREQVALGPLINERQLGLR